MKTVFKSVEECIVYVVYKCATIERRERDYSDLTMCVRAPGGCDVHHVV